MRVEALHYLFAFTFRQKTLLCLLFLLLESCANSQAPVREQGEVQVTQAPIIARTSSEENGGAVIERGAAAATSGSSSSIVNAPQARSTPVQRQPSQPRQVSPRSSQSTSAASNPTNHRVRAGDTLYSIAFQHDLDFRSLALANNMRAPYTIYVGQDINLVVSDLNRSSGSSAVNSSVGTEVGNNSTARAQGSVSRSSGVLRQPIQRTSSAPSWGWPHQGRILRSFREADSKGVDIQGRVGDSVLAAGNGDVVYAGRGVQGSGNLIIIRHSDRYLSAYAHNSVMLVEEGVGVSTGDKIAEVGETPAGEPMLHFEIRLDGKSVDPSAILPSR
ncbi:MAG: peptidoglycan DD-metalloendopeptidase family protein [Pseudohongiellaceae bacterium]